MEKDNIKHKASKLMVEVGLKIDGKSFAKVKGELTALGNKLPKGAKGYKILTKDKYIEYRLCGMNPCDISKETIKRLHERWDKHRKGYDFVILAGDMTYSVDYFNTVVLGGNRKHCISKEDILLGNISIEGFKEEILYSNDGVEKIIFSKEDE